MGASQFVGRVGGLAVALGVGAAMFSGAGVASADRGSAPDTRGSAGSASDSDSPASSGTRGRGASAPSAAASTVSAQTNTNRSAAAAGDAPISVPAAAVVADPEPVVEVAVEPESKPVVEVAVEPETGGNDPVPVAVSVPEGSDYAGPTGDVPVEPKVIVDPVVVDVPEVATPDEVTDVVMYATGGPSDGAGSDSDGPVDSSLADLILASFVRRETLGASPTDAPAASVTSSATTAPLTVDAKTIYYDGVLQGNLNVTSASGCGSLGSTCKLEYSFVDSSAGGKLTLNKVPVSLPGLPDGAAGGAGSYTFLPYATWIDPAKPTKNPTPTGSQTFTVRVTENTQFDQTITSIPLIGMFAEPIIKLLQVTPFVGNLLAPLIGATITQEVSVNVGQLVTAGKQVAYTYKVTSFDGTKISMNYFPASTPSLFLPGQQQATIFNGPGLGAPGETNPYGSFQAAGSVPGLSLMRGQGLPGLLAQAPLGFNVVTWDPRGEWDSGGVLQLDNPFYEGRDVSALIDWTDANTPLLNEGGKPDVAMMGGSYGGGIQMTTVDPRVKAIVPSIAWNSLNQSLYPSNVFKTGWANVLAFALLTPLGNSASSITRVNSQITQALITGNLFGFISETAQAVLSSSGPTALLTKLNIPTMYDQGTHDALFPLIQAIENAQTQLEQNPFFAGDNADLVKMIWFCGGHGVCTTQTLEQQTKQSEAMFLENMVWVNQYAKGYWGLPPLKDVKDLLDAFIAFTPPFQWWDQAGNALAAGDMPWTDDFQGTPITQVNATGGSINSFTSRTGPLKATDAAGAGCSTVASACEFPFNQVFATKANNAVNVNITVPKSKLDPQNPDLNEYSTVVGAPKVSFTYSGIGNAKAVYAQVVDNKTGQVLGNIVTPIPVTLDGKEHTIEAFPIADIAYTAPGDAAGSLTLQIVGNASLFANNAVIWNANISNVKVELPTAAEPVNNPIVALINQFLPKSA